ncbi:hypothetical protein V8C35DRAFT_162534 [Trichoderma chlorosporum]
MKEIESAKLRIYLNTSANTAMFMLSACVTLKGKRRRSNKQHIYLLMPPERINTITKVSPSAIHFSLSRGPDCVGPQDRHTGSKLTTQEQLSFMQDLAMVTELTLHLASSDDVARGLQDFERLATIFSLKNTKNRPCKDKKVGNLATLYVGKGGKVISENDGPVHARASPPPYTSDVLHSPLACSPLARSKKRKLNPDEHHKLDVNDEKPPTLMALIHSIYTRLDDIEKQSKTRHDDLKSQLETRLDDIDKQSKTRHDDLKSQLETRLDAIENQLGARFDTLEESIGQIRTIEENLDAAYTPCRYDSKERDFLLQELDERCEQHLEEFQTKSDEANEDLENGRDKGVTAIREEARDATSDLQDTVAFLQKGLRKGLQEMFQYASDALE